MKALGDLVDKATQGDADAQFILGAFYDEGFGVPQDLKISMAWLRKAAAQGHAAAHCSIGFNYAGGHGVPKDYVKARSSFQEAARQNNAKAQFNLGLMSLKGLGVSPSGADAAMWFRKAADQGYLEAKVMLKLMDRDRDNRAAAISNRLAAQHGPWHEVEMSGDRDAVTGTLHRKAMLKAVQKEFARIGLDGRRGVACGDGLYLASIGVDQSSPLDNGIGQANSDALLCGVADRLAQNLRRSDLLGRIGKADFAVCTPAVTLRDATTFIERLQRGVAAEPFETAAGPMPLTVSIGVAALKPGDSPLTLLKRANVAMRASRKAAITAIKESSGSK